MAGTDQDEQPRADARADARAPGQRLAGRGGRGGNGGNGGRRRHHSGRHHHHHNAQPHQGHHNQQRRHGKQQLHKQRMPSAADMPRVMAQLLREKKQALLHRVVRIVGPKISWKVLQETLRREREGGMEVNAFESGAPGRFLVVDEQTKELKPRRRTTGGVFFTLLREHVSKEEYRQIYEEEVKKKRELKNKIKFQRRQRTEKELSALGFDDLAIAQEADALGVTQDHVPSAGTSLCEDELDHAMLSCEEGEVDAATAPIDTVSDPTAIASI